MRLVLLSFLALFVAACAKQSILVAPSNDADKMLFFVETDRRAVEHVISAGDVADGTDLSAVAPSRVPNPAYVDIDSLLQINVRQPPGESARPLFSRESEQLIDKKERVLALTKSLDAVVLSRKQALDAYNDGNPTEDFDRLASESGRMTVEFVISFTELFPRGSPGYRAANAAIGEGGIEMLKPILQAEIDEIEVEDQRIKDKAKSRSTTLRLEAFLEVPGDELTALHLRGYDSLAEGHIAIRDRHGLNLSDEDRAELTAQIKATEDIASALESVRTNEASLQEGVFESLRIVAPDLVEQIAAAEEVADRLADGERIDRMKDELRNVVEQANDQLAELTSSTRARLESLPDAFEEQSGLLRQALQVVASARELERSWEALQESRNLDAIPDLLEEMKALGGQIKSAFDSDWLDESRDLVGAILNREFKGVENDASRALSTFLDRSAAAGATSGARSYYADIQEGIAIVNKVQRILGIGRVEVARSAPDVPEAFDVDINQLQDTFLDLRRVPGSEGDTITIRTRLNKPGLDPIESIATFELTRYGHYARLVPSVVLVRPDEIASGADNFRFAPALGWMHHYRPRPEEDGWFANVAGPLQPSGGLHAIFLNFDNESGIGLGGTISFWNDRLQFGAGYNLSASSSDDGQLYFFVGSDLIGLLQAAGIGN
jgi:hypothetical protein